MIAPILGLAVAQAAPPPETPVEGEILVMTERLRSIRISPGVTIRKGMARVTSPCKIKRSSGDSEIDALACDAVRQCAARPQPDRKAFNSCVDEEAIGAILHLREARKAELGGEAL